MVGHTTGENEAVAAPESCSTADPAITAAITSFNDRDRVADAVASALAQTAPAAREVVVIDDGSTDGTAGLLSTLFADEPRLRIVSQPNQGLSAARNRALSEARTEWVAFLDADDVWLPGRLTAAAEKISASPGTALVYSDLRRVGGRRPGPVRATDFEGLGPTTREAILAAEGPVTPSTYTIRVEDALAVGGFDPEMQGVEDVDFAFRVASRGRVVHIPRQLVEKSDRDGSMSKDRRQRFESTQRMVARALRNDPGLTRAGLERISRAEAKLARQLARDGSVGAAMSHSLAALRRTPRFGYAWRTVALVGGVAPLAALVGGRARRRQAPSEPEISRR